MSRTLLAFSTLLLVSGCVDADNDATADLDSLLIERTSEETVGMLEFINDYEVSSFHTLDSICALRSDTTRFIDKYRRGQDKTYGTADDNLIDSEQELIDIHMVGPWSVDQIYGCAEHFGYIDELCHGTTESDIVYRWDDWRGELPGELVKMIDGWEDSYELCGSGYRYETARLNKVAVTYEDCEAVHYTVEMVQMIDPEGGIQFWITHEVDADFRLVGGWCDI